MKFALALFRTTPNLRLSVNPAGNVGAVELADNKSAIGFGVSINQI